MKFKFNEITCTRDLHAQKCDGKNGRGGGGWER